MGLGVSTVYNRQVNRGSKSLGIRLGTPDSWVHRDPAGAADMDYQSAATLVALVLTSGCALKSVLKLTEMVIVDDQRVFLGAQSPGCCASYAHT